MDHSDNEMLDGIDFEDDDDDSVAAQMAMVVESMDNVVELVCIYRDKLSAQGFSEGAVEGMVVDFHAHLRG